jgi:hypothetical protein
MRIKFISNKMASSLGHTKNYSDEIFYIEERKEYIVYALSVIEGSIWYCICDKVYSFYPRWYSSIFFDVIDNRPSRFWIVGFREENNKILPFLSFPEWANDPYFYGELIDGNSDDSEAIIFSKYKEFIDLEFSDSSISDIAQIGDDEWLICPQCMEAWQSTNNKDALVRCPKCQTILNNPRYKNEWPLSKSHQGS